MTARDSTGTTGGEAGDPRPTRVDGKVIVPDGARFILVASRFNHFIVEHLVAGALDALVRHGASPANLTVVRVPGAWEIPLVVQRVARAGRASSAVASGAGETARSTKPGARVDAVIALAAVIRGSTPHFDYVASEVSKGVAQASLETGVPVAFGVLTTDSIEQAIERAGTKAGNKGWDAALVAIEMVSLAHALDESGF